MPWREGGEHHIPSIVHRGKVLPTREDSLPDSCEQVIVWNCETKGGRLDTKSRPEVRDGCSINPAGDLGYAIHSGGGDGAQTRNLLFREVAVKKSVL